MVDPERLPKSPSAALDRPREHLIAQPLDEPTAADLPLRPSECPSREQFSRGHEPIVIPTLPPVAPPPTWQFSISDTMLVTVGIAAGLAGGTWMPPEMFAALLGLVTLLGLMLVHVFPPEGHYPRLAWGTLVVSYIIAVLAALVRQW